MNEGEFWNNLDSFVEKKEKSSPRMPSVVRQSERVGRWLRSMPGEKDRLRPSVSTSADEKEPFIIPKIVVKKPRETSALSKKKKKSKKELSESGDETTKRSRKCLTEGKDANKQLYIPRLLTRRTKFKRKRKNNLPLYFGPLVDCTFNVPRVAQQLERLMGSSVVRLTDRKYMLDLQKRFQEDYHDTLMKRISTRQSEEVERQLRIMLMPRPDIQKFSRIIFSAQSIVLASELERERRQGNVGNEKYPKMIAEHPVFVINNKTNALLMSKREKLKTVRAKNAEELIKQGRRWEREKIIMAEQERINDIESRKEREKMLEEHTLYIFDPDKVDLTAMDLMKIKSRKFTDCEIDLKNFLLSERENMRIRRMEQQQKEQEEMMRLAESNKKATLLITTPTALRSQDVISFDEKQEGERAECSQSKSIEDMKLQITAEEMKRKQAKKDEDPRIARFKNAESVKLMYDLAQDLIAGDGKKSKLLKQIKSLRKSLNVSVIKGAQ